ncbi:MAG: TolC family protein [Thermoanaerobaculia bacterium]|nr:TolC family protein [Thermoanaerobaculia bacterium]
MLRNIVLSLSLVTLAGSALAASRYTPPVTDAPRAFATTVDALNAEPVAEASWWTRFDDPALNQLVDEALRSNHDLREAVTRVEAARAIRSEVRQASFPTGSVAVANTHLSVAREGERVASAGVDVGWEIDLFGRVRNLKRGAEAEVGKAEALLAQTRVVIAAEVVRSYFLLRGANERIELLERYRADQAEVVSIIEARVEEGVDDEADLARARTELVGDMLALANERHNARVLRNALAVLIGATPGQWQAPEETTDAELSLRPIAIGDPAALLQRRPDVRAAERQLAAETAGIGVATAGLFPQLNLRGVFGFVAGTFGNLGKASGEAWSAGPVLSWNVFDLGRVRAQIRRERAEAEGALVAYERTVLRALEDSENAFSSLAAAQESLGATDLQLRNARIAEELVEVRYDEGVSSYFEHLDARRAAVRAEIARIDSIAAHRTATVDVFRALGSDPAAADSR